MNIRKTMTLAVVITYAIWVEVIAVRTGEPWEIWWWALEIPIFLWIVAPIITAYRLRWDSWTFTVALSVIAIYSLYIYERDMFGPGARSTSALIFAWLPIYQWIGLGIILAIAKLVQSGQK